MIEKLENAITDIFRDVQFNKTCHQKNLKKLRKYHDRYNLENFWNVFVDCFRIPLTIGQRHSCVENTLQFIASFAVSFYSCREHNSENTEPMCDFLVKLFDFLLTNHCAKSPAVRFRICHFLNMLLNTMGDQAFIDDELCDRIIVSMMSRLLDKSSKVRAQAIFSLHRLQDPSNDQCSIIKMYIFHASKDPKAEVRRAALLSMGKSIKTLQVALMKTRDVDETVRKVAYDFLSKVTIRSLTIKQRCQLLNDGLKDRSEVVKRVVRNVLLPSWLRHLQGDFVSLARSLDAETATDTTTLAMETLFKSTPLNTLLEQVLVDKETKLIPIEKLCSENTLYWKCLVNFLHKEGFNDEMDQIIPELSNFCTHISDFLTLMSAKTYEVWEVHMQKFILLQLFEMTRIYDLSDEMGRKKLNELICNTLMTDHCSEKLIESVVTQLEKIVPDINTRLDILTNIISEIRLPMKETQVDVIPQGDEEEIEMKKARLKVELLHLAEEEYQAIQVKDYLKANEMNIKITALNEKIANLSNEPRMTLQEDNQEEKRDPETMIKCLTIICTMIQPATKLTPTLRSVMQIALDSLDHEHDHVHILALKALGIYCILDVELAKQYIMTFFLQLSIEPDNKEVWVMTLKAIFDLLLVYGLEYFDMMETTEESTKQDKSRTVKLYSDTSSLNISLSSTKNTTTTEMPTSNFIKVVSGLLDNPNQDLRTVTVEGLCKLLLNRRISSSYLLSRLIILCYNPANDSDFYMRQCLSAFFDNFVMRVTDAQEMLEAAYLPTLRIISSAPDISPLQEIDLYDVSQFILRLTRNDLRKSNTGNSCPHNDLAFSILNEVLRPDSQIDQETLIKSLKDLHVEIQENSSKENLLEALAKVSAMVNDTDKRLMKYVDAFKKQLQRTTQSASVEQEEREESENED